MMMMMQRKSSRDNRVAMIRPLLEEAEDVIDEEEIERVPTKPMQVVETITAVQTTDSVTVTVNSGRHRQHLVRRSSSVVERITIPPVQQEKKNGGDKSLRPRFLQERSATIVHITPAAIAPSRVPRSKASAFLLDVLAKSKGLSGAESRRASLEPLRHAPGVTNTLHYVPPQGVERGVPLRMTGRSTRRFGRQLSVGTSSDLLEEGAPTGSKKRRLSASQEHMAAIVRGLQANKQHLQQQFNILHSVLRFINSTERDDEGKRPVLKEMVDEGMIPELASITREFRFDTGLQVCIISILSALAEESPVYAYMMNELSLGQLIQKTAAVHATHDRLILLASNLVHAIEESKNTVNIPAYQAEKAAKFRRQSASYTDMIVAAITAKPKQSPTVSPPSSAKPSKPETSRRTSCQEGIVATEIARSRAFVKTASSYGSEREINFSAGKIRQGFDLNVAPPALSANYRLLFSQKLKKAEIQPLQIVGNDATNVIPAEYHNTKRDRPASSPSKKSLALDLTSKSLVAAIYSGSSIFVEPSPLTKRMPFRGNLSAGGVHRKLSVPKKIQRAHTERLPPTRVSTTMSSPQPPPMPERSIALPDDTFNAPVLDDMPIVADELSKFLEGELKEETEVQEAQEEQETIKAEENDDKNKYEDESYEDDFDTTGDDTDEDKTMPSRKDITQIGSDSDLIDMLQDISVQDSESSAYLPTLKSKETEAATTIQRHVRGVLVRRELSPPGKIQSCKNAIQQPEKKTSRTTNGCSSYRRRSSKLEERKVKRIPLSTRNLHTHGRNSVRGETMPQLTSRSRPVTPLSVSKKNNNSAKSVEIGLRSVSTCRQLNQETSKQFSDRVASSSQRNSSLQTLSLVTSSSEVDPEHETEDTQEVKTPPDPAALKQVQILYAEGLNHHKENHLGLAIECYEKALAIPGGQNFASLHVNFGSALMAQNKFSEALKSFKQAKCIQPRNTKAIYNYALASLHLDRVPEAQRLFRHILELEPTHEKAIIALSHLQGNVPSPEPKQVVS